LHFFNFEKDNAITEYHVLHFDQGFPSSLMSTWQCQQKLFSGAPLIIYRIGRL
jgi:hypothetical protein